MTTIYNVLLETGRTDTIVHDYIGVVAEGSLHGTLCMLPDSQKSWQPVGMSAPAHQQFDRTAALRLRPGYELWKRNKGVVEDEASRSASAWKLTMEAKAQWDVDLNDAQRKSYAERAAKGNLPPESYGRNGKS